MKRSVKVALILAAAMSLLSVFVCSASAATPEYSFVAEQYPVELEAVTHDDGFEVTGGVGVCETATFKSGSIAGPTTSVSVAANYSECKGEIGGKIYKASVNMNGCAYNFHHFVSENGEVTGKVSVECPSGHEIEVDIPELNANCVGRIPAQTELAGTTYTLGTSDTGWPTILAAAAMTDIEYSSEDCPGIAKSSKEPGAKKGQLETGEVTGTGATEEIRLSGTPLRAEVKGYKAGAAHDEANEIGVEGRIDEALGTGGGAIAGKVTSALAAPIEGIHVTVTGATGANSGFYGSAVTNSSGEYTVSGLPSGEYDVEFSTLHGSSLDYVTQYYNGKAFYYEAEPVTVTAPATTGGIDATLNPGGQIAGTVTSSSSSPIAGIEVCTSVTSNACARTDENGTYTISGLTAGEYGVEFFAPSGSDLNYIGQTYPSRVELGAGEAKSGIDAQLQTGGQIAGKVTNDKGEGLANICVSASGPARGSATTDADGEYTISGLNTGSYSVAFRGCGDSDYPRQDYEGSVAVTAPATTSGIDATLVAGGEITGKVTNESAAAIPYADVTVYMVAGQNVTVVESVQANDQGEYSASSLLPGEYKVEFQTAGYAAEYYSGKASLAGAEAVDVSAGATTSGIDEELKAPGAITGEVTSQASKNPLEGVEVIIYEAGPGSAGDEVTSTDTFGGAYTVSELPPGEYAVEFYDSGENYITQYYKGFASLSEALPVTVTPGNATPNIDAELQGGGKISGTVTGSLSEPLSGVEVIVYDAKGNQVNKATTDLNGEYTVSGLASGEYEVEFSESPAYVTQYYYDASTLAKATPVTVTAENEVANIDAALGLATAPKEVNPPGVTGTPKVGETLSCSTGTWTGTPTPEEFTYRWLDEGTRAIAGATKATYEVKSTDEGHTLVCEVTAHSSAGEASAQSTATGTVPAISPANTEPPEVTGTPAVGQALSCSTGTWESSPTSYTYQWLYEGTTTIAGATKRTYRVTSTDERRTLTCEVTAHNGSGEVSAKSAATATVPVIEPVNTIAPVVSVQGPGAVIAGTTLSCSTGTWESSPTGYTYKWLSNGTAITGAESSTYVLQASDEGQAISCEVTASNEAGPNSALSSNSESVLVKPANTKAPEVTGTAAVGDTLSCSTGTWSGSPTITYTYMWLRAGSPISGQTASTYAVEVADEGHRISCEVTATNGAGSRSVLSGNGESVPATMASGGEGSTTSPSVPAEAKDGTLTATASGGTGSVIVGEYESDPVGAPSFESAGKYLDVFLSPGSDFTSLSFTDCELGGGESLSWYDPESKEWQSVSDETAPSGSPPCVTVTIDSTTTPDLAQMTGTVFGVALASKSPSPGSNNASTGGTSSSTGAATTSTTSTSSTGSTSAATSAATGSVSLASPAIAVQSNGKALVKLTCAGTATCAGKLTLTVKGAAKNGKKKREKAKRETVGTASFSIPAGKTATVELALTPTGHALLSAAHGRLSAALTIVKASPAPAATQTDDVHLVLQKASKGKKGMKGKK